MLRSPTKRGFYLSGLALASLLSLPARAQNPTVAPAGTNVPAPDMRARMWAATARFVYGDDPALASLRPQLRQTIDSGSVKAFGRHLEDAVKLENKSQPKQAHVMKFQGDFKTLSAKNEPASQLASSITNRLLENKPERQSQPTFVQLRRTLNTLADPNAPVATATTAPASVADTATEPLAPLAATTPTASPAPTSDFTTTSTPSSPMLTWVPWIALALSIVSLLISLFKGNGSKRRHHSHSSSAPTLTSLTEEMRAEVRTIVQREVSNKMPGARPAPDAPARQPAPARPQAPAATTTPVKNTPAVTSKTAQPKPIQPKAPDAVLAPPVVQVAAAASPTATEPVATTSTEDDELFNINYIPQEETVAAPPAAPATRTLYANQQPIDGIFQRNMLGEAPASYTIFELITSADAPDQARFVVTGNPAGHAGYIGSHVNILGGACEYPFPKGSVSRIITDEPGVAQRTAGGDWQISKKARIHFE